MRTFHALLPAIGLLLGCADERRPPILFISIDTLAARHTSLHDYERPTTPNLDAFAAEAIVFENCYANAPWTVPSYLSQLSGLYPEASRVLPKDESGVRRKAWEKHRLDPARRTITERLRAAGYRTAAFWENPWLAAEIGFERGFEVYEGPGDGERLEGRIPPALAWLDGLDEDEPWFLFVQATDPHGPYVPPAESRGAFASGLDPTGGETRPVVTGRETPHGGWQGFAYGAIPRYVALGAVDAEGAGGLPDELAVDPIVAAYDEEILAMDAAFGRLIDELEERGILDEAIVVFTSDHGESMTQHGLCFAHGLLYDENLHVPLVVRLPGGEHGGRRIAAAAQLVDLHPTLLELAGLAHDPFLHGRSLAPLIRGESLPPVVSFAQGGLQRQYSVRLGNWKLVVMDPDTAPNEAMLSDPRLPEGVRRRVLRDLEHQRRLAEGGLDIDFAELLAERLRPQLAGRVLELFDLRADPGELHDLEREEPQRMTEMLRLLERELARGRAARPAQAEGGPAPGAEVLQALEHIGYAGGDL